MKTLRHLIVPLVILTPLLFICQSGWCQTASNPAEALRFKQTGDRYLQKGNTSLSISEYVKALALNPNSEATYFNLAIAYYSEKNVAGAIEALENLLKLNPNDVEAHYNLACLKLYNQEIGDAKLHFEKAKQYCPPALRFFSLIQQGLNFMADLKKADPSTQALALFLLQLQQGLSPSPVLF